MRIERSRGAVCLGCLDLCPRKHVRMLVGRGRSFAAVNRFGVMGFWNVWVLFDERFKVK
ncbi:hypothetical protein BDP81DRAFT_428972 [Colletotrichum phormii]|uniref:Uncharacterized protein n=1 Tax=Colletotrichum phormii TaxID=359342 RepID=A0AAI9ZQN7_9PEZI|nr:uncharacterized protein BDP81DRAFT_428972 [Colletotrichum phormii]KAK1636066.1 hypothetical protein BDP81DRAFT_428972 [Colletotrichum phormii]